jgi:hypothetical protein
MEQQGAERIDDHDFPVHPSSLMAMGRQQKYPESAIWRDCDHGVNRPHSLEAHLVRL